MTAPIPPQKSDSVEVGLVGDTDSPKARGALFARLKLLAKNMLARGPIEGLITAPPPEPPIKRSITADERAHPVAALRDRLLNIKKKP